MPEFKTGSVILISFPFTGGTEMKKRPAPVLLDSGDDDLVLARITTQTADSPFDCPLKDWASAGLKAPSFVRLHKLATLEKKLVEKRFGMLTPGDWQAVLKIFQIVNQRIHQC